MTRNDQPDSNEYTTLLSLEIILNKIFIYVTKEVNAGLNSANYKADSSQWPISESQRLLKEHYFELARSAYSPSWFSQLAE